MQPVNYGVKMIRGWTVPCLCFREITLLTWRKVTLCLYGCLVLTEVGINLYVTGIACQKLLNVGHYTQTVKPNVFIPALLIGTIDFYHFIPLSLTLTLSGGHKVTVQSKTYWLKFHPHFSADQDEIWCGNETIHAEHPETTFEYGVLKQGK